MKGLEYGSGISTIYFARKTGNLVSIEHDKIWHEHIRTLLAKSKLSNVNYILISPDRPESNQNSLAHGVILIPYSCKSANKPTHTGVLTNILRL